MDILWIFASFAIGMILGLFFFGVLWFTVRHLPNSRYPAILSIFSLLIRLAVVLVVFYLIAKGGHWERLLAMLLGMVATRFVLIRFLGPQRLNQMNPKES